MWPIGLVVGVAVAASMVMLVVGIALAITIERRRYRKYIERHTAGTTNNVLNASTQSVAGDCQSPDCRTSPPMTLPRDSPETWVALSSPGSTDQDMAVVPPFVTADSVLATRKSLKKTLHGPIKKKSRGRRRLKRTVPLSHVMSSPLSAIAEQSDIPKFSSESMTPSLTSERCDDTDSNLWLHSVARTHRSPARDRMPRRNSTNPSTSKPYQEYVSRSFSMTSFLSSAPGGPLPPLPINESHKNLKSRLRAHSSATSMDSVSSSVLEPQALSPSNGVELVEKTRSRALQDFDFALKPVMRLRSPVHLIPRGQEDPRAVAAISLRASVGSDLSPDKPSLVTIEPLSWSDAVNPAMKRAQNLSTGPAGRHSMFENGEVSQNRSQTSIIASYVGATDHVAANFPARPASVVPSSLPQQYANKNGTQHEFIGALESAYGHRRQNCVRISNLPLVAPLSKAHAYVPSIDPKKQSLTPTPDLAIRNPKRDTKDLKIDEGDKSFPWSRQVGPSPGLKYLDWLRPNTDHADRQRATTPDSDRIQNWRFDMIPPDTPKLSFPPSPLVSYNSPILPSPICSITGLRTHPRRSKVCGPRNPRLARGLSSSPLKPMSKSIGVNSNDTNNICVTEHNASRGSGSIDVRKSIQLLRSMNSEGRLLDSDEVAMYHRLGNASGNVETENGTNHSTISRLKDSLKATPACPGLLSPQPSVKSQTDPATGIQRSIPASPSSESLDGTSIWEDASVRAESPEPELPRLTTQSRTPALTPTKGNLFPLGNTTQSQLSTPRARVEDYEAYENFVEQYGKSTGSPSRKGALGGRPIGLGLRIDHNLLLDTPRSVYDESGFLKE